MQTEVPLNDRRLQHHTHVQVIQRDIAGGRFRSVPAAKERYEGMYSGLEDVLHADAENAHRHEPRQEYHRGGWRRLFLGWRAALVHAPAETCSGHPIKRAGKSIRVLSGCSTHYLCWSRERQPPFPFWLSLAVYPAPGGCNTSAVRGGRGTKERRGARTVEGRERKEILSLDVLPSNARHGMCAKKVKREGRKRNRRRALYPETAPHVDHDANPSIGLGCFPPSYKGADTAFSGSTNGKPCLARHGSSRCCATPTAEQFLF